MPTTSRPPLRNSKNSVTTGFLEWACGSLPVATGTGVPGARAAVTAPRQRVAQLASRTSATDVRSKNSASSFGAWRSSSASRSATIGVRPENSGTAAETSVRSLSPGGGQPQAGYPALGVTPQLLELTRRQAMLA